MDTEQNKALQRCADPNNLVLVEKESKKIAGKKAVLEIEQHILQKQLEQIKQIKTLRDGYISALSNTNNNESAGARQLLTPGR